jgi:hypothetical protein
MENSPKSEVFLKTVVTLFASLLMSLVGGLLEAADLPSTASPAWAPPVLSPSAEDRQTLETVAARLPKYHISNQAGLFIGSGPMLQMKGAASKVFRVKSETLFPAWDGPLVVLTNRKTGSGAELVAAALQDYGRALVIGDQVTGSGGMIRTVNDVGRDDPSENLDGPLFQPDAVTDEVVAIAADYLNLLKGAG